MTLKRKFQVYTLAAALGFGAATIGTTAVHAESSASQRLVESLQAMKVDNVDYLYAYLQTANITDSEVDQILANAEQAKGILNGQDANTLTAAQKTQVLNLLVSTAQLAHMQAKLVDDNGNALDISNLSLENGLRVQLLDANGKLLGTMDPKKEDLQPANLSSMFTALQTAVEAKVELAESGTFVPVENGELPETNSQDPTYMAIGALLVALGAAAAVPAIRKVRALEQE